MDRPSPRRAGSTSGRGWRTAASTAAINAIFYWFSNPIWIGATLALLACAAIQSYWWNFSNNSIPYYAVGIIYIWFSVYSAILSFGIGKWIPTIGAWCRIIVISVFAVTTVVYAFKHGLHFPAAGKFSPTWGSFIALTPLLFFNYVGFELPNAAGDEMKDAQKDVPFTVLRACITSILLYGLPILAIISVVPPDQIKGKGVSAFLDAVSTVFNGVYGSAANVLLDLVVFGFLMAVVSSACTWLMGSDRSQAVASYDGAGPRFLGQFSAKLGTPVRVELPVRRVLDDRVRHRVGADLWQRRSGIQRDDRRGADLHDHLLHRDLPDAGNPASQASQRPPALQGARRA